MADPVAEVALLRAQVDRLLAELESHAPRHSAGGADVPASVPRAQTGTRMVKNSSGGVLAKGSVVVSTTALTTDDTVTTSTTRSDERVVGVLLQDLPSTALGMMAFSGVVQNVKVIAGVTRYQFLKQSVTAGSAEGTGTFVTGCFGMALTSRDATLGTVRAVLFGGAAGLTATKTTNDVTVGSAGSATGNLFSFTVNGGDLGTDRRIRIRLEGKYTNNDGAVRTLQLSLQYGATTMIDITSGNITQSATARAFVLECELIADGATNAQNARLLGFLGAISTAASGTGSFSDISTVEQFAAAGYGTAAEDSTADKTLKLVATHSVASASLTLLIDSVVVEVV